MARTIKQIYEEMLAEAKNNSVLSSQFTTNENFESFGQMVTTASKTGVARMMMFIISVGIWKLEIMMDLFETAMRKKSEELPVLTERKIQKDTKAFQYGHALIWQNDRYKYTNDDAASRIVTQTAVVSQSDSVLIKVAKGAAGALTPLAANELTALRGYWKLLGIPGTQFVIQSTAPDQYRVNLDVVYDPLVLNPDGTLRSDGSTKPIEDALNKYAGSLDFNGRFWVDGLYNAIEAAQGVVSPDINEVTARYGQLPFTPVDKYYDSFAGYMALDLANSTVNYITA